VHLCRLKRTSGAVDAAFAVERVGDLAKRVAISTKSTHALDDDMLVAVGPEKAVGSKSPSEWALHCNPNMDICARLATNRKKKKMA